MYVMQGFMYIHSTSLDMSRARVCLIVHNHPMFTRVHRESLDMGFQCVANEVSNTLTAKNLATIMIVTKKCIIDYILNPLLKGESSISWHFIGGGHG